MKQIKISKDLCNYIEMLQYEAFRYKDLMKTIHRNISPMTDEEWEDSLQYYQEKCEEAGLSYQFAKEELVELYKEQIGEDDWLLDYQNTQLLIGTKEELENSKLKKVESYSNLLYRLYPSPDPQNNLKINGYSTKTITFQVTENCNMACSYCYQHNKTNRFMTFETAKQIIDMLLDSDKKTNSYITSTYCNGAIIEFIGGEPWLEIDLISQISDYFIGEMFRRKHPWIIKFKFSTCSNGLLYFEPKVQEYIKRHHNHLSHSITIDGNKELHDSCRVDIEGNPTYDRAIKAALHYKDNYNSILSTKMTIAPGNINRVGEAVIDLINKGYYEIYLNCVFEKGWNNTHANILFHELNRITDWLYKSDLINKVNLSIFSERIGQPLPETNNRNWCGGTGLMLGFNHTGNAYPCLRYMENSVGNKQTPYIIGNIKDGINILEEHKERIKCLSCITRKSQSTKECFECPIASGCAWCSGYNYEVFGTPDKRATFICCMHKARVLANYYHQHKKGNLEYSINFPKNWALEIISEQEYNELMKG